MPNSRLPWFHCYPDKWLSALAEMSPDQGYVYLIVCFRIYEKRAPIFDPIESLARRIGFRPSHVAKLIEKLCSLGKLTRSQDGSLMNPFAEREIMTGEKIATQVSTIRSNVAKKTWEKRKQNQRNGHTTAMQKDAYLDLDIDSEKERKKDSMVANATAREFDEFWKTYPRRRGSNPKQPARKKFDQIVTSGTSAATILTGATNYAAEIRRDGKEKTQFVAQAITWLNQSRYDDYQRTGETNGESIKSGGLGEAGRDLLARLKESQRLDGVGREAAGAGDLSDRTGDRDVRMLP